MHRWIRFLGAEETGVERIPEHMRTDQNPWDLFTAFFSANCCTATMALGYLGPASYGLGWWDSFLCVIFFNGFGAILPALVSRFGPKLGFRTMIIPRYSFGWYPAKVLALLNILNQIGWGMVNAISGASILYDVGGGDLPLTVAVLLISLVAIAVALLGYKYVHMYERYSWLVMLVCFAIVAGFGAPHFINVPMGSGKAEASAVLSFGTAIIGFEVAWTPVAADYGVFIKESTSEWGAVAYTFFGLFISQVLVELVGVAVGTLVFNADPIFTNAYDRAGIGGLIGAIFDGHGSAIRGFGKFVELILSFSTVAVIIFNIYSLGLSAQMVSTKTLKVPRFFWSLLGGAVFLAAAIAGRDDLEEVMANFLNMCAYWLTPFTIIVLLEDWIWRGGFKYDVDAWNDKARLPFGYAASISFIIGTIVSILCMSQVWWVGPIANGIGGSSTGTDVSWILALGVCTVSFVPLRYLERKRW
ncbi:purine-cytosine permease, partial [Aaosphaeria arxii CBS 175.79]